MKTDETREITGAWPCPKCGGFKYLEGQMQGRLSRKCANCSVFVSPQEPAYEKG
jgi:hypothetical protein